MHKYFDTWSCWLSVVVEVWKWKLLFVLLYLLFILVHAAPPLESFLRVNPICEDGGVEIKRAKPVILWKKFLWYYSFVNLLSVHFDLSTSVNYLLTLFVCSNEIDQRNRKSSHQLGQPTNALTNTCTAQSVGVEPNSESSYCQHSTYFSPLEDLWGGTDWSRLQHIQKWGPPSQRGGPKRFKERGRVYKYEKQIDKYNNTEKKHLHFHVYRQLATSYIKIFSHVVSVDRFKAHVINNLIYQQSCFAPMFIVEILHSAWYGWKKDVSRTS